MEHMADCIHGISIGHLRFHPVQRLRELRRNNTLGHVAAVLLFIGLAFAIASDGELSLLWTRLLFMTLFVLDVVMTDWLVR